MRTLFVWIIIAFQRLYIIFASKSSGNVIFTDNTGQSKSLTCFQPLGPLNDFVSKKQFWHIFEFILWNQLQSVILSITWNELLNSVNLACHLNQITRHLTIFSNFDKGLYMTDLFPFIWILLHIFWQDNRTL